MNQNNNQSKKSVCECFNAEHEKCVDEWCACTLHQKNLSKPVSEGKECERCRDIYNINLQHTCHSYGLLGNIERQKTETNKDYLEKMVTPPSNALHECGFVFASKECKEKHNVIWTGNALRSEESWEIEFEEKFTDNNQCEIWEHYPRIGNKEMKAFITKLLTSERQRGETIEEETARNKKWFDRGRADERKKMRLEVEKIDSEDGSGLVYKKHILALLNKENK